MTAPQPPVNIPGAYTLTVNYNQQGQEAVSVIGLKSSTNGFLTRADGIIALQAWMDNIRNLLSNQYTVTGGVMRSLIPLPIVEELPAPNSNTGTSTQPNPQPALSYLVKWNTARGGRSGKGRTFIPGVPPLNLGPDGRTLIASVPPLVTDQMTALLQTAAFGGSGMQLAVISRKFSVASAITSGTCSTFPGVQRRRLR